MDNKVCENIKMVTRYDWLADKYLGYLELKHLPVPGSITVYLQGQLIQPESFDACGNPIISEEMTKLFTTRQQLNFRNDPKNNTEDIYARIYYEPQDFTVSKNEFDTVAGIQKSLVSLKTFNQMISNRRRYLKAFGKEAKLSEYVIWNKYILDKFGKIKIWNGAVRNPSTKHLSIMKAFSTLESFPDVYEISALSSLLNIDEHLAYDCEFYVPSEGSICPICGREMKHLMEPLKLTILLEPFLLNGKQILNRLIWQSLTRMKSISGGIKQVTNLLFLEQTFQKIYTRIITVVY